MKTSAKIIKFFNNLVPASVPGKIEILDPYGNEEVHLIIQSFYKKYFNDSKRRILIFGINPGRFGGGLTGIPFTDPYNLKKNCGINSSFPKKKEMSSKFIYEMILSFGDIKSFYKKFFISSICPYGFVRNGKNLNYYDDLDLTKKWKSNIIKWIDFQIKHLSIRDYCIVIGKGKNQKFFEIINKEYKFFKEIIVLPHPRWILQYRSKDKNIYISEYVNKLKNL